MPLFSEQEDRRIDLESKVWLEGIRSAPPILPLSAPRIKCGSCAAEFANDSSLFAHNFDVHPFSSFYVRVNGQIARDLVFIEGALSELEVVPIGPVDVRINLRWSDGSEPPAITISPGRSVDLVTKFGPVESGEVRLWARTAHGEDFYRIYVHDPPELDYETLDEMVFESQLPLLDAHQSNWVRLRDSANVDVSPVEQRYLLGFASYLHGCDLEGESDFEPARRAFESAFKRLAPFATPFARDARAILAFRMHAMDLLRARGSGSAFWQAANFFQVPPALVEARSRGDGDRGIWIDDFQEGILNAVGSFARGDLDAVETALTALPINLEEEAGNELKKLILTARLAKRSGNLARARTAYNNLVDHPVYGPEAREQT